MARLSENALHVLERRYLLRDEGGDVLRLARVAVGGDDRRRCGRVGRRLAPQPAPDTSSGKSIEVSISQQHVWAYENGQEVYSFVASTGMRNSTRIGNFSVLDKIPNAYGSTWNIWMPDWMGIYYSGTLENGFHALPILPSGATLWEGFLGTPISYGCIVLGTWDAEQLYNWSEVGVPVTIHW